MKLAILSILFLSTIVVAEPRRPRPKPILPANRIGRLIDQAKREPASRATPVPILSQLSDSASLAAATPTATPTATSSGSSSLTPSGLASLTAIAKTVSGGANGSAPASAGSNSAPVTKTLTYDESAKRGKGESSNPSAGGNGGGGDSGGGGGKPSRAKPIPFPKWFPMCVFMDGGVRNGNEVVKGLVDMAADCGVNLVVFPFYSKNIPGDPQALKDSARAKCNAEDGFRQYGVNRAAVTVLTSNRSTVQQMCNTQGDSNVCAEMGYPTNEGTELLMRSTGRWGGVAPAGKAAVSVVAPNANGMFDLVDVAAGQGQSHLNRPPGYGGGNRTGDNDEGQAAGGAGGEKGWSKSGCQAMQEASFPNTGKWKYSPDQTDYVVKDTNDKRYFDLASDKTVFRPAIPPPKGGKDDNKGGKGGGSGSGSGGGAAITAGDGPADPGHKKSGGIGGAASGSSRLGGIAAARLARQGGRNGRRGGDPGAPIYAGADGESGGTAPDTGTPGGAKADVGGPGAGSGAASAQVVAPSKDGDSAVSQTLTYDEKAQRSIPGAVGANSQLTNAGAFFSATREGAAGQLPKNGLDGDFFKKILVGEKEASDGKRRRGDSLRKSPSAESLYQAQDAEVEAPARGSKAARADRPSRGAKAKEESTIEAQSAQESAPKDRGALRKTPVRGVASEPEE